MNRHHWSIKVSAAIAIIAGCAGVTVAVRSHATAEQSQEPAPESAGAMPVTAPMAAPVAPIKAPDSAVWFPASIEAFEMTDLYGKASGYVSKVSADIGDHVKQGQVLAVIDDPELQDDAIEAQATLEAKKELLKAGDAAIRQAQEALTVARRRLASFQAAQHLADITLKRQEELFAGKAATDQQLDDARAKADVARADSAVAEAKITSADADLQAATEARAVASAQADIASAQLRKIRTLLQYTQIVAPFDGVITRRSVNRGDLVQASAGSRSAPLFTCQQIRVVRVFCQIPEANAGSVRVGDRAVIKVFGLGWEQIPGTITRIASALNPQSRTMRAEIDLPNPSERLRAGMYAQVTLASAPATRPSSDTGCEPVSSSGTGCEPVSSSGTGCEPVVRDADDPATGSAWKNQLASRVHLAV